MIDIKKLKKELTGSLLLPTSIEELQAEQKALKDKIRTLNQEEAQLGRTLGRNNMTQVKLQFLEFWETSGTPTDDALVLKSDSESNEYVIVNFPTDTKEVSELLADYPTIHGVDISTEYSDEDDSSQGVITNCKFGLTALVKFKPLVYKCNDYLDVMSVYKVFEKVGAVNL